MADMGHSTREKLCYEKATSTIYLIIIQLIIIIIIIIYLIIIYLFNYYLI